MTEQQALEKVTLEYEKYMNQLKAYSKPQLFEKALWIHAIQMTYEHIREHRLESDDLRLLTSLPKPLHEIARQYMKTYSAEGLALSVAGGIVCAGREREAEYLDFVSDLKSVKADDNHKSHFVRRLDNEYGIFRDIIVTLSSRNEIITRAESISLWQSVYAAMKEYPYDENELKLAEALEHPFLSIAKAVEETAPDDMEKWDLFEASLDQVHRMNEAPKKKSRSRNER